MVVKEIPIKDIVLPEISLRRDIDIEKLEEIVQSIKSVGLLQPIRVRAKNGKYVLITGLRRLKAFQKLGRKTIRSEIDDGKEVSDVVKGLPINQQDQIKMIVENYQRVKGDDLKESEVVSNLYLLFYKSLGSPETKNGDYHTESIKIISEIIGVSDFWVRSRLNIQKLTDGAKLLKERLSNEGRELTSTTEKLRTKIPIRVAAEIGSKIKDEDTQIAVMDAVAGLPTDKALKVVDSVVREKLDPYIVAEAIRDKEKPKTKLYVINAPTEIYEYYEKIAEKEKESIEEILIRVLQAWVERGYEL
ncbi:MAG: ParB N-terminal domain-containing protein [Candidatus Heimdallarchaeota archaeon]|nr:ParB N-terminal domain-containing protein [Candidatus Heimdallarchaeota archaeon]